MRKNNQTGRILPKCSSDAKIFSSDVYKKHTQARKYQADGLQFGRSMVEMLGVLAIIGVLSVGAIAGYQKAMFKYKLNKTISELSSLFQALIELDTQKIGENAEIISADDVIKYSILPQCEKIQPRDNFTGCKLPLGYIMPSLNNDDYGYGKGLYGYISIGLTQDRVNSCIGILSHHFENIIPVNLWGEMGYIAITGGSKQYDVWSICDGDSCLLRTPKILTMDSIQMGCNNMCKNQNCEIDFVIRQEY